MSASSAWPFFTQERLVMSNTKNVILLNPIKRGDTEISQLTLREPKAGELRGLQIAPLQMGDTNALIKLVPRISQPRIEESEVADLSGPDIAEVADAVSGFFTTSALRAFQTT
jgi:hypothetical protein